MYNFVFTILSLSPFLSLIYPVIHSCSIHPSNQHLPLVADFILLSLNSFFCLGLVCWAQYTPDRGSLCV